jgi:hypothetical protein
MAEQKFSKLRKRVRFPSGAFHRVFGHFSRWITQPFTHWGNPVKSHRTARWVFGLHADGAGSKTKHQLHIWGVLTASRPTLDS